MFGYYLHGLLFKGITSSEPRLFFTEQPNHQPCSPPFQPLSRPHLLPLRGARSLQFYWDLRAAAAADSEIDFYFCGVAAARNHAGFFPLLRKDFPCCVEREESRGPRARELSRAFYSATVNYASIAARYGNARLSRRYEINIFALSTIDDVL